MLIPDPDSIWHFFGGGLGAPRGTTLSDATRNKERTDPELLQDRRSCLVVFGIEIGGGWSDETATFLGHLA